MTNYYAVSTYPEITVTTAHPDRCVHANAANSRRELLEVTAFCAALTCPTNSILWPAVGLTMRAKTNGY